jgi:hypothetical protein
MTNYDPPVFPYARAACAADVPYLVEHLRPQDHAECEAGGTSALAALTFGLVASRPCLTLLTPDTGAPAAMLGVTSSHYDIAGKIWLLGTPAIERFPKTFLRNSREALAMLYGDYSLLYNYTDCRNGVHHRWLKWLGFKFLRRVELTPDNYFYEFVRPR